MYIVTSVLFKQSIVILLFLSSSLTKLTMPPIMKMEMSVFDVCTWSMVDKYVQKGFLLDHTHSTVVGQIQLSNLVSWAIQNNTMSEFYHAVWHGTIIKHETQLIITSAVMLKRGCRGFKCWNEYPRGSVQHIGVSCWTS